jgi:hypothetical protein
VQQDFDGCLLEFRHFGVPDLSVGSGSPGRSPARQARPASRETGRRPPRAGRDPTRHPTLYTTTHRWRAAVVAALAIVIASSTPAPVVLATPGLAGPTPAGSTARHGTTSAPASRPLPSRAVVTLASVAVDSRRFVLPAEPSNARALDTLAPGARTRDSLARVPEPPSAKVAPAAPTAAPAPTQSAPRAVVRAAGRPARLWAQLRDGLTVAGVATWYFGTRGYAGIPHVAMPGARYLAQGRTAPRALVCAGERCTVVRVVDACGCSAGTQRARVVDLSAAALIRLGLDHRRGVYQVRVTLLAP